MLKTIYYQILKKSKTNLEKLLPKTTLDGILATQNKKTLLKNHYN